MASLPEVIDLSMDDDEGDVIISDEVQKPFKLDGPDEVRSNLAARHPEGLVDTAQPLKASKGESSCRDTCQASSSSTTGKILSYQPDTSVQGIGNVHETQASKLLVGSFASVSDSSTKQITDTAGGSDSSIIPPPKRHCTLDCYFSAADEKELGDLVKNNLSKYFYSNDAKKKTIRNVTSKIIQCCHNTSKGEELFGTKYNPKDIEDLVRSRFEQHIVKVGDMTDKDIIVGAGQKSKDLCGSFKEFVRENADAYAGDGNGRGKCIPYIDELLRTGHRFLKFDRDRDLLYVLDRSSEIHLQEISYRLQQSFHQEKRRRERKSGHKRKQKVACDNETHCSKAGENDSGVKGPTKHPGHRRSAGAYKESIDEDGRQASGMARKAESLRLGSYILVHSELDACYYEGKVTGFEFDNQGNRSSIYVSYIDGDVECFSVCEQKWLPIHEPESATEHVPPMTSPTCEDSGFHTVTVKYTDGDDCFGVCVHNGVCLHKWKRTNESSGSATEHVPPMASETTGSENSGIGTKVEEDVCLAFNRNETYDPEDTIRPFATNTMNRNAGNDEGLKQDKGHGGNPWKYSAKADSDNQQNSHISKEKERTEQPKCAGAVLPSQEAQPLVYREYKKQQAPGQVNDCKHSETGDTTVVQVNYDDGDYECLGTGARKWCPLQEDFYSPKSTPTTTMASPIDGHPPMSTKAAADSSVPEPKRNEDDKRKASAKRAFESSSASEQGREAKAGEDNSLNEPSGAGPGAGVRELKGHRDELLETRARATAQPDKFLNDEVEAHGSPRSWPAHRVQSDPEVRLCLDVFQFGCKIFETHVWLHRGSTLIQARAEVNKALAKFMGDPTWHFKAGVSAGGLVSPDYEYKKISDYADETKGDPRLSIVLFSETRDD